MFNQNQQDIFASSEPDKKSDRFSIIFEKSPIPSSLIGLEDFRYTEVNSAWCNFYGFPKDEVIGRTPVELQIVDNRTLENLRKHFNRHGTIKGLELSVQTCNGEKRNILTSTETLSLGDQNILINMVIDITDQKKAAREHTERRKLEKQLIHAQKMEAVGRLAGGVAHDFNNMLSLIIGYAEQAMDKANPNDPVHEDIAIILDAGKRSAAITQQLLGFARKQPIAPQVVNLNEAIENALKMLRGLIGENIDLSWLPSADLWNVWIDSSQLDQILTNLCINAKDAIHDTGKIIIETANITLDETYCSKNDGFIPGEYVLLSVSDNGSGMDKETRNNIFIPFFTTKAVNSGTGLGLSTIFGIVKQNSGFINVYSEQGKGTTFKIYLARHLGKRKNIQSGNDKKLLSGQGETLLLVEDEPLLLDLTHQILNKLNYKVLLADNPEKAIRIAHEHKGDIHLLITDVILPHMNGPELAEHIKEIHPGIKCLYMSGYTINAVAQSGVLEEDVHFISKPFTCNQLAEKTHEALTEN